MNNQGSALEPSSGARAARGHADGFGQGLGQVAEDKTYGDSGGASRFFYVAKASKRDRNEGLEELEAVQAQVLS
jgi:hypothetical protein